MEEGLEELLTRVRWGVGPRDINQNDMITATTRAQGVSRCTLVSIVNFMALWSPAHASRLDLVGFTLMVSPRHRNPDPSVVLAYSIRLAAGSGWFHSHGKPPTP